MALANMKLSRARTPNRPSPDGTRLRRVGGEISEVVALAGTEELSADAPVILGGRFERGGLFQMTFLPKSADDHCEIEIVCQPWPGELGLAVRLAGAGASDLAWCERFEPGRALG